MERNSFYLIHDPFLIISDTRRNGKYPITGISYRRHHRALLQASFQGRHQPPASKLGLACLFFMRRSVPAKASEMSVICSFLQEAVHHWRPLVRFGGGTIRRAVGKRCAVGIRRAFGFRCAFGIGTLETRRRAAMTAEVISTSLWEAGSHKKGSRPTPSLVDAVPLPSQWTILAERSKLTIREGR